MDPRFAPHNTHLENPETFEARDPHLGQLRRQALIHHSQLLEKLPSRTPGVYTIGGGRQIGKTTLMKQWMALLMHRGVAPERIAYFTGELIDDHHSLVRVLGDTLGAMPGDNTAYLVLDEVTYIKDWDKGVKYLADAGMLQGVELFLTGSDLAIIKEARMRFPGRRGDSADVDFHLYPLNLWETVRLKGRFVPEELDAMVSPDGIPDSATMDRLYREFDDYLVHGGFLTAMNDLAKHNTIPAATFLTYSDWIRGDVLKRGKQDHYLREILGAIVKRYGSRTTWNALALDLSIDHPKTVSDYVELLAAMDAAFIQPALIEDKLAAAPKKARKLMFTDPFIFHAVRFLLTPVGDPCAEQVRPLLADPEWTGKLVEGTVVTHYRRYYPTFYIKAEGDVDVAYIEQDGFRPVEVKWTRQGRPKDLKQIAKYGNGRILTQSRQFGHILGVPTVPLPLALLRLGNRGRC